MVNLDWSWLCWWADQSNNGVPYTLRLPLLRWHMLYFFSPFSISLSLIPFFTWVAHPLHNLSFSDCAVAWVVLLLCGWGEINPVGQQCWSPRPIVRVDWPVNCRSEPDLHGEGSGILIALSFCPCLWSDKVRVVWSWGTSHSRFILYGSVNPFYRWHKNKVLYVYAVSWNCAVNNECWGKYNDKEMQSIIDNCKLPNRPSKHSHVIIALIMRAASTSLFIQCIILYYWVTC